MGHAGMRAFVRAAVVALLLGVPVRLDAWGQEPPSQEAQSQGKEAASKADSLWSFGLSPYMWFAGLSGDVGVNQTLPVVRVDIDFDEIFDSIDWFPPPVMLVGEVRYGRFAFVTDFMFLGLETDDEATRGPVSVAAEVGLDTIVWTFGGSFRAVDSDRVSLDLLAGGRLWNVDAEGTLAGPLAVRQRSGSKTWVDPLIGMVGRFELGSGFAVQAEGDVGGFGIASDIGWQLLGTLQYRVAESVALEAGYRYLAVDYDDGGFLFDVAMHGPIIGASFRF
jgi:opacity protein-like surface antigen